MCCEIKEVVSIHTHTNLHHDHRIESLDVDTIEFSCYRHHLGLLAFIPSGQNLHLTLASEPYNGDDLNVDVLYAYQVSFEDVPSWDGFGEPSLAAAKRSQSPKLCTPGPPGHAT